MTADTGDWLTPPEVSRLLRVRISAGQLTSLRSAVETFESASGVRISDEWAAGDIGAAVQFVRSSGLPRAIAFVEHMERTAREAARQAEVFATAAREALITFQTEGTCCES